MIPKTEEAKLKETLIKNHIGVEHPAHIAVMKLIAPDVLPERQWVYPQEGPGRVVTIVEAKELLASGEYADHPDGPIVARDVDNNITRSWEKQEEVSDEIVYTAENGDTVYVRDTDGNPVGEPQYLKPLTMADLKDEIVARAVGVGIDPPDTNKGNILGLIEKRRVEGEPETVEPMVTIDSSLADLAAAAEMLKITVPEELYKQEAVDFINAEATKKPSKE